MSAISAKSVSFAEQLEEIREVIPLTMAQICGDWGATVRGDKTDNPHWGVLAGRRQRQLLDILMAWKQTTSN